MHLTLQSVIHRGSITKQKLLSHDHYKYRQTIDQDPPKYNGEFMNYKKEIIQSLLDQANIEINGKSPWDIQVKDERFYTALAEDPEAGLGDSYTAGWWECEELDKFFFQIFRAQLPNFALKILGSYLYKACKNWLKIKHQFLNLYTIQTAFELAEKHYDIGNDLYQQMLGKHMIYSCGYWKNASHLDKAQEHKLELICQKLHLEPGMKLLDIGCGWGGFARYAAQNYGVKVVGITISQEQYQWAKEHTKDRDVEIRLQDYRHITEKFDRIASIGMFEHVGYKNYQHYMQQVNCCLKEDGLFLLHTIGGDVSQYACNSWINKNIFPHSMIPSIQQIGKACEKCWIMEDWQNFGADYDKTLLSWNKNFKAAWPSLQKHYDETFYRKWNFYLLSSAGAFRARTLQVWQILLSKHGLLGGYSYSYPTPLSSIHPLVKSSFREVLKTEKVDNTATS